MRIKNDSMGIAIVAALVLLSSAAGPAWGQLESIHWIPPMQDSQLVFHGQVVDVTYARAQATEMEPLGMPHMFVTYRVDEVLHGEYRERELTLRFLGGYDDEDQSYLGTNLTPRFDLGDEDILFVVDNGQRACPLVGNHQGRLRVIDGQVYNDDGHSLRIDSLLQLDFGVRYDLPEVSTTEVMGEVLVGNYNPEARKGPSDAAHVADLLDVVRELASDVEPSGAVVETADPRKTFVVADYVPAPMQELADDPNGQ